MRIINLTTAQGGINRLRVKGSPKPDSLYDMVNCYVTHSGNIVPRPGTVLEYTFPEGTVGATAYNGKIYTFANEAVTITDDRFDYVILKHPTNPVLTLSRIHFAEPFLGYLYVVAEFIDESVWHYWLQPVDAWEPYTTYIAGDVVEPTVPNGFAYRATRLSSSYPLWAPNVQRYVGEVVEPTTADGYYYTVTDTVGDNPRSGATEPDWNAETGAITIEDVDISTPSSTSGSGPVTAPTTNVPSTITDRYGTGVGDGVGTYTEQQ